MLLPGRKTYGEEWYMKKRLFVLLLAAVMLAGMLPVSAAAADGPTASVVMSFLLGHTLRVSSVGRYANWAGVSNVSQFVDEKGRFCCAADGEDSITVIRTDHGKVVSTVSIPKTHERFGGAVCDDSGNLYLVFGDDNYAEDTSKSTVYVCKYDANGKLLATVGGNGSEGMSSGGSSYYTKVPFGDGNCDVAINGGRLVVNYAREMYNGHQANALFVVDLATMTAARGIISYNSHSFDQRVSPYGETGFLLESQGDCYPRAFAAAVTNASKTLNEMETFRFWVEEGTWDDYDMIRLNTTRSRLGNILETSSGAMLVAASVRSLDEKAQSEPYDLFVQVFDPMGKASDPGAYVTSGVRSGKSGQNGDKSVTDYGVSWLTDFGASGKTVAEVQAVSIDKNTVAVLYELNLNGVYDSTWYMLLNGDGSVRQPATSIGDVRLNRDEDPVYADGAVQWVTNAAGGSEELRVNALFPAVRIDGSEKDFPAWTDNQMTDVTEKDYFFTPVVWALRGGVTNGVTPNTFDPAGTCTRAQAVTFLWRAAGSPKPSSSNNPFTDVKEGTYYHDAVLWAVERGITNGTTPTLFDPDGLCRQCQILTFLYRAKGEPSISGASYSDAYYGNAVAWAFENGLTDGAITGDFVPDAYCTRAQIVTFMYRDAVK